MDILLGTEVVVQLINLVAIDVTVTGHPTSDDTPTNPTAVSTPGTTPARPAPTKQTLDSVHQAAATRKLYCHQYTNTHPHTIPQLTTAKQFVQWFLDHNIAADLSRLGRRRNHFRFGHTHGFSECCESFESYSSEETARK